MSLPVTEDTPPDMLAGSMDLNVVLPNGKSVRMSIQRSTPMMDLLVQVATSNRLNPSNYSIQAMGDRGLLPYKPSTPIGTLDAFTIKIVDKKLNNHKKAPQAPQSFLNTFRLQIYLPRSQLFVVRVQPDVTVAEILSHVCSEKNLDINKYELRISGNPDQVLELDRTLGSYKIQELSLVNKNSRAVGGMLSSADILHVKSSKHRQNSVCDSSLSSGSLGSRSNSPVPVHLARVPPQPPIRKKRRPAPKPPQMIEKETKPETNSSGQVLISHSRESSDSSGYHEASVLSESPTHGVALGQNEGSGAPEPLPRHLLPGRSYTNLTVIPPSSGTRLTDSVSNMSLNSSGVSRKKRVAPPPPIQRTSLEEKMKSSTLPTSRAEERIMLNVPFTPAGNGEKIEDLEREKIDGDKESMKNSVEIESNSIFQTKVDVTINHTDAKTVLEPAEEFSLTEEEEHESLNWQYQLPPPPTDFRDTHSPSCTEFGTVTITPDIYKEDIGCGKESGALDDSSEKQNGVSVSPPLPDEESQIEVVDEEYGTKIKSDTPDARQMKEKSSSVANLFTDDVPKNRKVSGLSYSRSFAAELPTKSFKMAPSDAYHSEKTTETQYENEIKYKNSKNLEKSLSVDCLQIIAPEEEDEKIELRYRKSVAPAQKTKVTERWPSQGAHNNAAQRKSDSELNVDAEAESMAVLHQQFLAFLKEKKLSSDLNMKSLNVIRHILPQINGRQNNLNGETESRAINSGTGKGVELKRTTSALMQREIKENVVIIENVGFGVEGTDLRSKRQQPEVQKDEQIKRYSYHAPPSINFATWGERPKTQVLIKDDDYVTEEKVTKKIIKKPADDVPKPVNLKKPTPLQLKKPGTKTNYEMFSALPKKKEVTSLVLVQMEDEEKRKKELSRVPVVCGVELKKEFQERGGDEAIKVAQSKARHSVSIFIDGNQRSEGAPLTGGAVASNKYLRPMPVVKGFRTTDPNNFQSHVNNSKICNFSSSVNINVVSNGAKTKEKNILSEVPPPPPPPPLPVSTAPETNKVKTMPQKRNKVENIPMNPRDQLMEDIRNFRGFNLKKVKTAQ